VDSIKLLLDKVMSVNLTNTDDPTPLHVSAGCGKLEATNVFVERRAALKNTTKHSVTPLMVAAQSAKL
jgi:ankyrin repeat protein